MTKFFLPGLFRSTPRHDAFYGGRSDLTGGLGWVENGNTYLMFRKKRWSEDPTDHDFNGDLHLIWAHGQSGQEFYGLGELKYHGGNRGKEKLGEFSGIFFCVVGSYGRPVECLSHATFHFEGFLKEPSMTELSTNICQVIARQMSVMAVYLLNLMCYFEFHYTTYKRRK